MSPLEMIAEWRKGCSVAGPLFDSMMTPDAPHSTNPGECHECTMGLIVALEKALPAIEADAKRLQRLIELCGYVEDGSCETVRLYQDDATKDWFVDVGYGTRRSYFGRSARAAIDAALAGTNG